MKKIVFSLALVGALAAHTSAFAATTAPAKQPSGDRFGGTCSDMQSRIADRLGKMQSMADTQHATINTVVAKIESIIARASEQGVDTSELQQALDSFTASAATLSADAAAAVAQLTAMQTFDCANNAAGWGAEMQEFKELTDTVKNDVSAMRKAYVEQVKPVITNLKEAYLQSIQPTKSE
jgi:hypothetical protein